MKKIVTKIETLGGIEAIKKGEPKENQFQLEQYLSDNKLKLPSIYLEFSKKYGSCMFNNDVVFSSISKIPTSDEDGSSSITIFYGWEQGDESLQENREALLDQIPEEYFVFAEAEPGDKLLINTLDNKIYYWAYEEPGNKCIFLVANSFQEFIEQLKIEKSDVPSNGKGCVSFRISDKLKNGAK